MLIYNIAMLRDNLSKYIKEETIMNFDVFETMYAYLWEFIYKVLKIFGYEVVDGDIVKIEG